MPFRRPPGARPDDERAAHDGRSSDYGRREFFAGDFDGEDFQAADFEALARRLEQAFQAAHQKLLDAAGIPPEELVEAFIATQSRLLGFDAHARKSFADAVEEARVKTLSQGNLFLCCVLCSAVALSEFKRQPLPATGVWQRYARRLRQAATHKLSLGAFAWTSFYALLGSKGLTRVKQQLKARRDSRALGVSKKP